MARRVIVSVLVPFRAGCPYRERAWAWVRACYEATHPDWELVEGSCADGPYNRSEAILDAASRATGDTFVIADADVWCDPQLAVEHAAWVGWAIPHLLIHRLSEVSTERVLAGAEWHGLSLSTDNKQDSKPYRGHETGTLVVVRRDVLNEAPPDRRFVGWGQEDDAWARALNVLIGKPWRGSDDLVHLWHPPQPRRSRIVGTTESQILVRRYRAARRPEKMRALIEEARHGQREDQAQQPGRARPAPLA